METNRKTTALRLGALVVGLVAVAAVTVALVGGGGPTRPPTTTAPTTTTRPTTPATTPATTPTTAPPTVSTPPTSVAPPGAPPGSLVVTAFGADPTGQADSTLAIRRAIAAAEAKGGTQTVYFPAGTYVLDHPDGKATDLVVRGATVNILGAGAAVTKIVEEVGTLKYPTLTRGKNVFAFDDSDGFTFSGLTVDSQTYNAGDTLIDNGDDTTIEESTFLGARNGPGTPVAPSNVFDLRVVADCNQNPARPNYLGRVFHYGNTVKDVTLVGRGTGGNDDLDFACQQHGTISDIVDTGWGTALYLDRDVTVTNFTFTPGGPNHNFAGWYVTDSADVTITNFVTSGRGGIVNPSRQYPSSNITIDGEQMTTPGFPLTIGDASNVDIANSRIAVLKLIPDVSLSGLTVTNSSVGTVVSKPKPGATVTGVTGISP